MAFCNETYCGEDLSFYVAQRAPGAYDVEVRKTGGTPVVRAAVELAPSTAQRADGKQPTEL